LLPEKHCRNTKALSLLEDSLGSRCFPVQTFLLGYVIMDFRNGLQIYVIYRPNECLYLSDAISCGVGGIIALPQVFESDQPKYCCAVLELVTMEEKQDFDLETEKVFQALQVCFHYIYFFNQILDNDENTTQFIIRI